MIEVERLCKSYGAIQAVRDLSFTVGQGSVTGFLGPNGAGKSTTMRILTGFFPANSGSARVAGFEVHKDPLEVKRREGYLPERVPLYEEMTISGFMQYIAEIKNIPRNRRRVEIGRVLDQCGLSDMGKRLIGNISKGYRQRVGLAQAILGSPPVLILDEPTVGLDPAQIIEIRELIKKLGEEHTILLSTHILPEVVMVCDHVVIINHGQIAAQDSMENLVHSGGDGARTLEDVFMAAVAQERGLS